jgi:hypothetical protein
MENDKIEFDILEIQTLNCLVESEFDKANKGYKNYHYRNKLISILKKLEKLEDKRFGQMTFEQVLHE